MHGSHKIKNLIYRVIMIKIFHLFVLFITLNSFQKTPQYLIEARRVSNIFINNVCQNNDFKNVGNGGRFIRAIEGFNLTFYAKEPANIDKARNILVEFSKKLINIVNNDNKIRPFLLPCPLPIEKIVLVISYPVFESEITLAIIKNGKLFYGKNNGENNIDIIHTETYEEAVNILQSQGKL